MKVCLSMYNFFLDTRFLKLKAKNDMSECKVWDLSKN